MLNGLMSELARLGPLGPRPKQRPRSILQVALAEGPLGTPAMTWALGPVPPEPARAPPIAPTPTPLPDAESKAVAPRAQARSSRLAPSAEDAADCESDYHFFFLFWITRAENLLRLRRSFLMSQTRNG